MKIAPSSILLDRDRLNALERTELLDSPPDVAFDRLTALARSVLGVPVVVLSLVDGHRQFFKSESGLPAPYSTRRQTPLTHSFCQWVVASGKPLRVADARQDDLVCDNLAITDFGVRAYFGVPITDSAGHLLGAFAAIDSRPRDWTPEEHDRLQDFAAMAMTEIDLRMAVAEAREAERRFAEGERRYRTVVDNLNEVVFQTNGGGRWIFLNAAWEELTGFGVPESLHNGLMDLVHPNDAPLLAGALKTLESRQRTNLRYEFRLRRKDGDYRWTEMRARLSLDAPEGALEMSGTLTDVNERYEGIKRLAESEVRFRTVVESLGEGLIITDLDDRIQYVNDRMAAMAGYTRREMIGCRAYELLIPEADWPRILEKNRSRAQGVAEQYQICFRNKEGQSLWVEIHATPYYDADGKIVGTLSANSDITARRDAELKLRAATEELRRSNESLQEFASVASHDLQEPLRKIQAFGDRLQTRFAAALGEEGGSYVERMQSAASRMQSLINDLLLFSRVTSKSPVFKKVDLNRLVAEVLSDLETRIQQTGGRVEVGSLPILEGDPLQLRQLFQNLIGNALKFHKEGEPPLVEVRLENTQPEEVPASNSTEKDAKDLNHIYRISVKDYGIGFDSRHAERIFEVFERLNSRTEFEGTGMGLAICRRIVERHGGTIRAISDAGAGTKFIVDLPILPNAGKDC